MLFNGLDDANRHANNIGLFCLVACLVTICLFGNNFLCSN